MIVNESNDKKEVMLTKTQESEKEFYNGPWQQMTECEVLGVETLKTPEEKACHLYDALIPALDTYIEKYKVPTEPKPNETLRDFLSRITERMYGLNQQHEKCWGDAWPTTALDIGRTNCAYGSLILARAINRAGVPIESIDYATPGPLSHAAIIVDGLYADQTNGVVVPASKAGFVGNIKCYKLNLSGVSAEAADKVPFRLVPVHSVPVGIRSLVSNLDPLIEDSGEGGIDAVDLVNRFGIGGEQIYAKYAFEYLMPKGWTWQEMKTHPEWQKEYEESSKRIKGKM